MKAIFFVEGEKNSHDKRFIECLVRSFPDVREQCEVIPLCGYGDVVNFVKDGELLKEKRKGKSVFVICDANDGIEERRGDLETFSDLDGYFLFSNNRDAGCLEDLLIAILKDGKKAQECFDNYKQCLKGKGLTDLSGTKEKKARLYACLEAYGAASKEPDFDNKSLFDLGHSDLEPIKSFLKKAMGTT